MRNKLISLFLILVLIMANFSQIFAGEERQDDYNELRSINIGTFNEYGYKLTEQFFKLKQSFQVNDKGMDLKILKNIDTLAVTGYKYLPDTLNNKKYLSNLQSAIQKGQKYTTSDGVYSEIVKAIEKYLYDTEIKKITGTIEVSPSSGNAPLNVTLRAKVVDPTGTIIPKDSYIWWVDDAGKRKIIGKGLSINYTLNDEGKFSVFLDVLSNHRNAAKYTDVLPFRSRADIEVKQKVANLNIKINDKTLRSEDQIKFSPDEASYGIIFDATSSTPTSGTKFLKTTWDFGNGVKREYDGGPKVERVTYGSEGDYIVKLKLKTNELQEVERKFTVSIHKPIATITSTQDQGFIGDRFTFSANPSTFEKNLTYNWEIIDIDKNDTILQKAGNLFTYEFVSKGKFNVKLKVTDPSGDTDVDNRIIYINSRAPVAEFNYSVPKTNKPNRILFDATKSFDQDFTDDGKLEFSWEIDGKKIDLENPNYNGSLGFYTFDSVGDHSVTLEVTDPDDIKSQKNDKVKVTSVLSVEFNAYPLVIQRNGFIKFLATSPEARFFKWDFGDGNVDGSSGDKISHKYEKSGIFDVRLDVSDSEGATNSFVKKVYVSDSNYPYSLIDVQYENSFDIPYDSSGCEGKGAYIIDRTSNIKFSGGNSINIDGQNTGLTYSWKVGTDKFSSNSNFTQKFDEIGCFPVKLTVRSDKNKKTHTTETYVQVKNLPPVLTSLNVQAIDINADPVIVNVSAVGAKDLDGVIPSYLWYYYTDTDREPQDYRVTVNPATTFVLPKISGSYYFVLVLKDNNDDKFSSEQLGGKFYVPLTGDNVNTPLLDVGVSDSSLSVEDDVVFNVKVRNVIGQDLTDKAVYSWDFNGDGFYDKEVTGKGTMTHKFEKAGTYHVKVKAKYKGISNVKTITVDVINNLKPDFEYISILNKFVLFNKSSGKYTDIVWELGDGNIKDGYENFIYSYLDGKTSHEVTLKISEGTKMKEIKKTVTKNTKNLIKASKDGLNIFSVPEITSSGNILLTKNDERVFLYLGESKGDFKNYIIDYDLDYDSDLNGGKDDDVDNKDTTSYTTGEPVEIKLNGNRVQKIRIALKDSNGKISKQQDIEIIKNYIIESEKKVEDIVFKGVTEAEKQKIELLKTYISDLPQEYRVAGMNYLERLQSEWFDQTEKTKVILEFEGFIDNPDITNSTEIINLLESILVEGQADKTQKNIAFNALKNLLREDIDCKFEQKDFETCKLYLVSVLENIRDEKDIEKAKELSKILLQAILDDKIMSDKEKLDFKEILKGLIYDGVENPTQVEDKPVEEKGSIFDSITNLFAGAAWTVVIVILVIFGLIAGFWFYFKLVNKDKNKGFEEFIIEKTSPGEDILGDIEEKKEDILFKGVDEQKAEKDINNNLPIIDNNVPNSTVPDWLKSSFTSTNPLENTTKEENVINNQIVEVKEVESEKISEENKIVENPIVDNSNTQVIENDENIITEEKIEDQNKALGAIPDWLKGDLVEDNGKIQNESGELQDENKTLDSTISPDLDLSENNDSNLLVDNDNEINAEEENLIKEEENAEENLSVPDWLKGSLVEGNVDNKSESKINQETEDKNELNELDNLTKVEDSAIPDWLKGSLEETPKKSSKPKQKSTKQKPSDKKTDDTIKNSGELWQDGMSVPDWLDESTKTDDKK